MSGSGSTDTEFNPEIFNTRRTVVAPMVCFVGYLFVIVAILYVRRRTTAPLSTQQAMTNPKP